MFTGIVEATTTVLKVELPTNNVCKLTLHRPPLYKEAIVDGQSIAINGCCLTVCRFDERSLGFDVSSETLDKTNLALLKVGSSVNVERAMPMGARLDGHIVTGHVDGQARIHTLQERPDGWLLAVEVPTSFAPQIIPKGSICLDGVSLTINKIEDQKKHSIVSMMLIPTTLRLTTLAGRKPGDQLNLETDILGKYFARARELLDRQCIT